MAQKSKSAKSKASSRAPKEKERKKNGASSVTVRGVLGLILPMFSLVIAFVAVVLLYRRLMPPTVNAEEEIAAPAEDPQVAASSSHVNEYDGLEDKWLASGNFTTGNKELDAQVKAFCDALATEGATPRENAQKAYNTIVWSEYKDRSESERPTGSDWDKAAAHEFFSAGVPEEGKTGAGDFYEFAAAASFCLRYFGFYDAIALPVVAGSTAAGQSSSALILLSDEYGQGCVCDPTIAGDGWMLDSDLYDIVVEDIEQDLSQVEALGLKVQTNGVTSEQQGQSLKDQELEGQSSNDVQTEDYSAYDTYSYDNYSEYDYGYDYDAAYNEGSYY